MHGHKPVGRNQLGDEFDVLSQPLRFAGFLSEQSVQRRINFDRFGVESVLKHLTNCLDLVLSIDDQLFHALMIVRL